MGRPVADPSNVRIPGRPTVHPRHPDTGMPYCWRVNPGTITALVHVVRTTHAPTCRRTVCVVEARRRTAAR